LQLFFLSILLNGVAGLSLLTGLSKERMAQVREFLHKAAVRSGLGIATAIVGFGKLIFRSPLDQVAVAGDLIPALAGLAAGTALMADVYMNRHEGTEVAERLAKTLRYARIPIGVTAVAAAVLHLLFSPAVPF
jgi:hypothetical protein